MKVIEYGNSDDPRVTLSHHLVLRIPTILCCPIRVSPNPKKAVGDGLVGTHNRVGVSNSGRTKLCPRRGELYCDCTVDKKGSPYAK